MICNFFKKRAAINLKRTVVFFDDKCVNKELLAFHFCIFVDDVKDE